MRSLFVIQSMRSVSFLGKGNFRPYDLVMPIRDAEYMQRDRRKIAAAAAEVLFEKGVSDTSIRDICKRSGVSMGGVYVHFASKRDIIVAAIESLAESGGPAPSFETWADLVALLRLRHFSTQSPVARQYARFLFEFLGSIVISGEESPQLRALRDKDAQLLSDTLLKLKEAGEIAMPLGLEATRSALLWISLGRAQDFFASPTIDIDRSWVDMITVMEALVGPSRPVGSDMRSPPDVPIALPKPKKVRRAAKDPAGKSRKR